MRTNLWKISTLTLAGALALVVGNGAIHAASADPQPRMVSALEHLKQAREDLIKATVNKGGHRAKAIDHVNQAIEETKLGIQLTNKR
jgi:hypothetical protein